MRLGKLSPDELRSVVFSKLTTQRPEVVLAAALGEDSAALDLSSDLCVVSTDPITGASAEIGRLGVFIACNDVATNGAEPVGILLTIFAPPQATLEDIALVMDQATEAAAEVGVQIIGGHTEVTAAVNQMIISCTAIGRVAPDKLLHTGLAKSGDALVLVRTAGLEGTAIIAGDHGELLLDIFTEEELLEARSFSRYLNIVPAAILARVNGAVSMHDVTEGGVLGAAYEMAEAAGLGLELTAIPVHPLTIKLCRHLSLDPLRLISSGALLVATPTPDQVTSALLVNGIPAQQIGSFLSHSSKVTLMGEELHPPNGDELWAFKSKY
ncbi:MAG: hydrogenase expression/formation protein HypE [Bacillota bacterium]|nr:MAG: hydrogenase expression/formation protein HypE [Bacillota bacterium]MBS3950964.1 AIR synthase family protein [Peptococcaceae bacterium]